MYAAVGKESTVEQCKIRRPVNPRLCYQKESYPRCQTWTMHCKAHDILRKARLHKSGGYKTFLDRWNNDDKYRKSLSDIRWSEEQIIQYDVIALEDHSYVATKQERGRNEKSWKLSLNAESIQGPLNQKEAKQKCKRLYHKFSAITGDGNKPIPPGQQQVRQRLDQRFEGLEEYDYRLERRTGWRYYPSSRTTHSSLSSNWQSSSDGKSTWSWDSWQTSSWTEQQLFFFFNCSEMLFRLPEI